MLYKVFLTFEYVIDFLKCGHSSENYWAELSCGATYYIGRGDPNIRARGL